MLINDAEITGSLIVNASSSFQNMEVSGNILPGINNIHNLGSPEKYWKEIYVSTSSINFVDNGIVTASLSANTLNALLKNTSSTNDSFTNINSFTQSFSSSISTSLFEFSSSVATSFSASNASIASVTGDFSSSVAQTFITQSTNLSTLSSSVSTSFSASEASVTSLSSSTSTSFSSSAASITSLSSSVSSSTTSLSSSLTLTNVVQNNRLSSIESKTGSYATTGSNTFFGTQTYSGSVYIANDLIVQGSSSIQYISASSVSIGTNIVQLNTANPSVRFAGLSIIDSGSIGGSGSFLYDSVQDEFIFVHRGNGINVTSSHFVLGPETYDNLGNETYLTNNKLPKGTGKEHLVDSQISDDGTTISIGGALTVTGNITGPISATNGVVSGSSQVDLTTTTNYASGILTRLNVVGVFSGSSQVSLSGFNTSNLSENTNLYYTDARVKTKLNAETVVSGSKTISGIALGSNLATLTIGTGLSGTSYNGSTAVTIANSGVTSNVAGTGVTVSGATGAVTISIGQSVATSATPTFGKVFLTTNLATGIANNSFNTSKAILGNIHMQNGDGTSGDNKQAAITFQGGNSSEAQAGIYVSNNNSSGTAMGFATTDSYATGPQVFMTATNGGIVNFPRAVPTYAGTSLVYNSGTWGISTSGNAATATAAAGVSFITQPNATWSGRIQLGGNGDPGAVAGTAVVQATDGNLHIDCGTGKSTYVNYYRNGIIYLNGGTYYISSNGSQYNGNAATATNAYGARFQFDSYGNWTGGAAGGAAIVNSNEGQYQALMIVGNSSAGGVRVVKMWDNVQVQGAMSATADITAYFSDGRLKENLQPLKNAISKITTLTGYTYNTNALGKKLLNNENVSDSKVGLIAQDLQKVLPEAVKLAPFDNDGKNNSKSGENYLTIQYEKVVPLLVEAIKEQQIKIENLTIEVENLKKPKGL